MIALHDFIKKHGPAAIVSAIGTAIFFLTYDPRIKASDTNKSTYELLLNECKADQKKLEQLDPTKEALYKSNTALTVNNYNMQSLTKKINELEANKAYLNSQLELAISDNRALRTKLSEYEKNREVFEKLASLEKKKDDARSKPKEYYDPRTLEQFRQDNEMIAQETHVQILDLQNQFKCLRGS